MISIVVPVYNEEESLAAFYQELVRQLSKSAEKYEVLFIDDGSMDNSLDILKKLQLKDKNIRIFSFRKNRGKAEALTMGFQKALGSYVVTLDADLQDKPSEINKLLTKLKVDSLDAVSGWRKDRKDKSKMIAISRIYNYLVGRLFGLYLHDYNCGLKVYTSQAAKSLYLYGGQHRFIPLLLHQQGYIVDEMIVEHSPRIFGKSKYGFSKVWKDLPDIFTMTFLVRYSRKPLHFFGPIGGGLTLAGTIMLLYLIYVRLVLNESIGRRPLLIFAVLFVVSGLQIFFTGFIAELLVNLSRKDYSHVGLKYTSDK